MRGREVGDVGEWREVRGVGEVGGVGEWKNGVGET